MWIVKIMQQPDLHDPLWKEIPGESGYFAHPSGCIKSGRRNEHKILKLDVNWKGYQRAALSGRKKHSVHRLILKTFVENPEGKSQANHKNGVRADNRVENLEWSTPTENNQHRFDVLGYINAGRKFSEDEVLDIRSLSFFGATFQAIANVFGVSAVTIGRIVHKENYANI